MYIEYVEKLDKASILLPNIFDELLSITGATERIRKETELEERAKVLGVKTQFNKLYKAAKRDLLCANYASSFSGQDYELDTGSWQCSDEGICTLGEKGLIWACSHPIYPTRVLVNIETGTFKVELKFFVKGKWRTVLVDKETIASNTKIIKLASWGVNVTSENSRALVKYLSDIEALNEDVIVENVSTSRFGWMHDAYNTFMPYGKDIIFDNSQNLKFLFDSINQVGNRTRWYELAKELRKTDKKEIAIYMASSLASVLVDPCGALPFIVNLWGETGKGKTVLLKLAASIWADPGEGQYMADAKSTVTAQEVRLDTLNSLPMLIDDMAQIKNQYDGDFSNLIYRWCSGQGKDRSNINLSLDRLKHWKNCILTNAEHSLITETMQGGAINRIIDVEMDDGYIFQDGNYVCEVLKDNYGWCGREFIDLIQEIGFDKVREIQKDFVTKIKETASKKGINKEEKQIIPMSIILTADKLATDYLYQDGIYLDFMTCFNLLKDQGEVSEHKRACQLINDSIAQNYSKFSDSDDDEYKGERWGKIITENGQDIAVIIGSVFSKILSSGGFQERSFLSWAKKNDIIKCDVTGKTKKTSRIGNINTRCVFFKLQEDDDFAETDLDDIPF